jgi:hypothetical protein
MKISVSFYNRTRVLIILLVLTGINYKSKAQTITANAYGSDYRVYVNIKDIPPDYFCETYLNIFLYQNNDQSNPIYTFSPKTSTSTTYGWRMNIDTAIDAKALKFFVGPSNSKGILSLFYWYGKVEDSGPGSGGGCINCFCVHKSYTDPKYITTSVTTSNIKPPKNVYASNDTSDSYIDIKWEKGTDIPNDKVKYYIYRNDTLIGNVTETDTSIRKWTYRDKGLSSGRRCKYTVTTWTDQFQSTTFESVKTSSDSMTLMTPI